MSKFNPTSWLNRSRVFSESSGDFSTTESLAGLNYASQSSLGSANLQVSCDSVSPKGRSTSSKMIDGRHRQQAKGNELLRLWNYDNDKNLNNSHYSNSHHSSHNLQDGSQHSSTPSMRHESATPKYSHARHKSLPVVSSSGAPASFHNRRQQSGRQKSEKAFRVQLEPVESHYNIEGKRTIYCSLGDDFVVRDSY